METIIPAILSGLTPISILILLGQGMAIIFGIMGQSIWLTGIERGQEMTEIRIYQDLCKGTEECGICLHVCQKEVFSPSGTLNKKGFQPPRVVQDDQCSACENCMIFCPDLAIVVSGEKSQRRSKK